MSKIKEYILNKKLNKLTNNIGKCTYENGKITCFVEKNIFDQMKEEFCLKMDDLVSLKLNKPITEINYIFKNFDFYHIVYISNKINKDLIKVNIEFIGCNFLNNIYFFDMNNLFFDTCTIDWSFNTFEVVNIKKIKFNHSNIKLIINMIESILILMK